MASPRAHGNQSASKSRPRSVKDFELSNETTRAFLGGKARSWMIGKSSEGDLKTSPDLPIVPILPHHDQGASPAPVLATFEYKAVGNNKVTSIPFPPDFDRGRFPSQRRRRRGTKNHPRTPLACATSSASPCRSSIPALVEASFPRSESSSRLSSSADNVLPSPSPSIDTQGHSAQMLDSEDDVADPQTSRPSLKTRLEDLVVEYGGFEELGKRLDTVEKASHEASPVAMIEPERIASNAGLSRDSSPQKRSKSLGDRPTGTQSFVEALHITTPQKRVQNSTNEPRKRSQGDRNYSHAAPDHQQSTTVSGPTNDGFNSPTDAQAEMGKYCERLTFRLQNNTNRQDHRSPNVERPRLELLRDACGRSDYFYLTLHQIFCLDHRYRGVVGLSDVHRNGLNVLSFLLVPNEQLTPEAVEWFSVFPRPVECYEQRSAFKVAQGSVMRCLELLGSNWEVLRSQCTLRGYPPLVDELVGHFDVASLTFQRVIFTALLRDIWILPQDQCYHIADLVFARNYKEVMGRSDTLIQVIQTYNQSIIEEYQRILSLHLSHTQIVDESQMAPPRHRQISLPANRDGHNHHHRTLTGRIVERPYLTPLQIDVQAARGNASTKPDGPRVQTLSISGKQTASYVTVGSSPIQASVISPYSPMTTNGLSTSQSASYTRSPIQMQGNRSPLISRNQLGQVQGPGQLINQTILGSPLQSGSFSLHTGTPARRPAHILPSNAPWRAHTSRYYQHHDPERVLSTQFQPSVYAQSQSSQPQMHSFTMQPANSDRALSRLCPSPSNQFIRFDPTLLLPQSNLDSSNLHQAHVISPPIDPVSLGCKPSNNTNLFQFVKDVIMPPTFISSNNRHVGWNFALDKGFVEVPARDQSGPYGSFATSYLATESRMYRVRCVKADKSKVDRYEMGELKVPELISQSEWVVADNIWPGSTAVLLNGTALEIRKKSHHGKDLPIDATHFLKEGDNHMSTAIIGFEKGNNAHYAIGVEIIQVTDEDQIRKSIPTLSWKEARQRLIDRSIHTDPDVQVIHSQIIIDLIDPFTARLFDVPVRGSTCRHNQCFDRDVFLQTRTSRNSIIPCGPDGFRCPICGADARPPSLVIDGFFVSVRKELEEKGRLDAKRILLHELGDWEIKEEEESTGEQGDGTGRRVPVAGPITSAEVVEIDDD